MSFLSISTCFLLPCLYPPLQRAVFSLEWGDERGENICRWAQFVIVLLILFFSLDGVWQNAGALSTLLVWSIIALSYTELILRFFVKNILPLLGKKHSFYAKIYRYITDNPDNLYYSNYVPHPFLQFTGPRGPVPGTGGDFFLGFKDIKLSDVPKPDNVIRIACLGGSTTADGYPEFLEEYLCLQLPGKQFQVLNFGTYWWSSLHSTVNYVLNVIDFKPDFVVLHDSCNDHHYRGFPGLRGDCSHAYRLFLIPQTAGETLYRYSLIFRILKIVLSWKFPARFRSYFEMKDIGLNPGKTYKYVPAELRVIERNIETVCTLASSQGSKICLTTMPLSIDRKFSEEHDRVYRPHTHDVNMIIREKARRYGCLLADFDEIMTGKEQFFKDAVHSSIEGNKIKAQLVGNALLLSLQELRSLEKMLISLMLFTAATIAIIAAYQVGRKAAVQPGRSTSENKSVTTSSICSSKDTSLECELILLKNHTLDDAVDYFNRNAKRIPALQRLLDLYQVERKFPDLSYFRLGPNMFDKIILDWIIIYNSNTNQLVGHGITTRIGWDQEKEVLAGGWQDVVRTSSVSPKRSCAIRGRSSAASNCSATSGATTSTPDRTSSTSTCDTCDARSGSSA